MLQMLSSKKPKKGPKKLDVTEPKKEKSKPKPGKKAK